MQYVKCASMPPGTSKVGRKDLAGAVGEGDTPHISVNFVKFFPIR